MLPQEGRRGSAARKQARRTRRREPNFPTSTPGDAFAGAVQKLHERLRFLKKPEETLLPVTYYRVIAKVLASSILAQNPAEFPESHEPAGWLNIAAKSR
jgi:hypothetical protein